MFIRTIRFRGGFRREELAICPVNKLSTSIESFLSTIVSTIVLAIVLAFVPIPASAQDDSFVDPREPTHGLVGPPVVCGDGACGFGLSTKRN